MRCDMRIASLDIHTLLKESVSLEVSKYLLIVFDVVPKAMIHADLRWEGIAEIAGQGKARKRWVIGYNANS